MEEPDVLRDVTPPGFESISHNGKWEVRNLFVFVITSTLNPRKSVIMLEVLKFVFFFFLLRTVNAH